MKYTTLTNTDLKISQICLGTGSYGSAIPETDAFGLYDAYVEHGGNVIDTARVYADWLPNGANASERTLGNWLQARGNRTDIIISTKGGHPDLKTMHISRLSRAEITVDVETSLKYLQTDVIDLYWLHRDDPNIPVGDILGVLNDLVQAGKLRYLGCSNWTIDRIRAANEYAAAHDLAGFVANQPLWSLAVPNLDQIADKTTVALDTEGLAFHRETGLAALPYTAQARGYFTKRAEKRRTAKDQQQYDNPTNDARFKRVLELADHYETSVTAIGLAYLYSQSFPVSPIIGPRNLEQLDDCLLDVDLTLTPAEVASLEIAG